MVLQKVTVVRESIAVIPVTHLRRRRGPDETVRIAVRRRTFAGGVEMARQEGAGRHWVGRRRRRPVRPVEAVQHRRSDRAAAAAADVRRRVRWSCSVSVRRWSMPLCEAVEVLLRAEGRRGRRKVRGKIGRWLADDERRRRRRLGQSVQPTPRNRTVDGDRRLRPEIACRWKIAG